MVRSLWEQYYHVVQEFYLWVCTQKSRKQDSDRCCPLMLTAALFTRTKMEAKRTSIDRLMDNQNVLYKCHRTLFSLKKDTNSATAWMDLEDAGLRERIQAQEDKSRIALLGGT